MRSIYLDYAATTPIDERVLDTMMPFLREIFGNPGSVHQMGQRAKQAVEEAREIIAKGINADPSEIIFTSGGTESNNTAIKGVLKSSDNENKVITSELEHKAVLQPLADLQADGLITLFAEPTPTGEITADSAAKLIDSDTALVTLMHLNNEIGTINDLHAISEVCKTHNVPFHTDAVQSFGKIPIDVVELGVDLLSASAHKLYGPKGVGLLYVKNNTTWTPLIRGGSQERKRRGGTSNVAGIVGFAKAFELAMTEMETNRQHFEKLRHVLLNALQKKLTGKYHINGNIENGAPHILNISFYEGDKILDGKMLLLNLDMQGICVSNGSACSSGAMEPSHVLKGIGLRDNIANSSIRISFGTRTTEKELLFFVDALVGITNRMFK